MAGPDWDTRGIANPRRDQPQRRQCRRLSRPDVHDGVDPEARLCRAEASISARIASGELRLQSFGITEPDAGSETPRIKTFARPEGDHYVVNGQKIFTSRYQHSDMLLLLTRTTAFDQVKKKTDGMSLFLVNLKESGDAIRAVPDRDNGKPRDQSAVHRESRLTS